MMILLIDEAANCELSLCNQGMRRLLYKGKKQIRQGDEYQAHVSRWEPNQKRRRIEDGPEGLRVWEPRGGFSGLVESFLGWVRRLTAGSATSIEQDRALALLYSHRYPQQPSEMLIFHLQGSTLRQLRGQ